MMAPIKLLLITFEMDPGSQVLAWQFRLAQCMAAQVDEVVVLTHRTTGDVVAPNAEVRLFPLWLLRAPMRWLGGPWLVNAQVWWLGRRRGLDVCYVHMNAEWAYRLRPAMRWLRMPMALWYAHGSVSTMLERAVAASDVALTSSPLGLRLESPKVRVIGQGVDADAFRPVAAADAGDRHDVLFVGRISERKGIDRVIDAFARAVAALPDAPLRLRIVGAPITDADRAHADRLRHSVAERGLDGRVLWRGHVDAGMVPAEYGHAFVHVNLSDTGSMDKTVLESLASGCPVVTSNPAFAWLDDRSPGSFLADGSDVDAVAGRIVARYEDRAAVDREGLRVIVLGHHDLASHARRVVEQLRELVER